MTTFLPPHAVTFTPEYRVLGARVGNGGEAALVEIQERLRRAHVRRPAREPEHISKIIPEVLAQIGERRDE